MTVLTIERVYCYINKQIIDINKSNKQKTTHADKGQTKSSNRLEWKTITCNENYTLGESWIFQDRNYKRTFKTNSNAKYFYSWPKVTEFDKIWLYKLKSLVPTKTKIVQNRKVIKIEV